ncbi:MAG TPA: hypothetical protein VGK79_06980 [Gaiellaceae bacterium]
MQRLALLAVLLVTCVCAATSGATTRPSLLRHVSVKLTSSTISLSTSVAYRGDEVEFAVRNRTRSKRIFSVAGKAIVVPANKLRLTAISFQARGRYRVVSRTRSSRVTAVFRVQ